MNFPDDLPFWLIVNQWEKAHWLGEEIAPEDFCRGHPETLADVLEMVESIKATGWWDKTPG